jgi:tetratricopeptide (TPR) repeat protein
MKYLSIICLALFVLFACKNEPAPDTMNGLEKLYKDYEVEPNAARAEIYLDSLMQFIPTVMENKQEALPYLQQGVAVSMAQGLLSSAPGFLLPLLRNYPNLENRKQHLLQLGDVMFAIRKRHASNIVYKKLTTDYPNDAAISKKKKLIEEEALIQEDYVTYLFDQLTINADKTGINKSAALKYVDAVEAFALVAPNDESVPRHLYGAAEVARSLRTFPKAMSLYDWILENYPTSEKAPNVLFIKGFILEQDYNRDEEARSVYEEFLAKYPTHQMAESAQFLLNNLGKTDEEILREIEKKRKKS